MMATFRCKRSNNTVSFTNLDDIEGLRKHEGYTEVLNERPRTERVTEEKEERKDAYEAPKKVLKKRGRPSKK